MPTIDSREIEARLGEVLRRDCHANTVETSVGRAQARVGQLVDRYAAASPVT